MAEMSGKSPREYGSSVDALANLLGTFKKGDAGKAGLFAMAEECAKTMPSKVTTNQLRNLLNLTIKVKQSHQGIRKVALSEETLGRLAILRPRIAYMAARCSELRPTQKKLDELLKDNDAFKFGEDVDRLYEFVEALVAFHKYENPNPKRD